MDFCVFYCCCCFLEQFIARNPLYPSQTTCGCETNMSVVCQVTICLQLEELSYKSFSLVEKCIRCSFKLNTGCPVLFLSNRKNTLFSDVLVRKWIQMFFFWSIHMLKYVKVRQHNLLKFSKKRVGEDESRSVNSDNDALD